ncbi:ubiquitin fusion degradation protein UFD1-domain-containing protein [Entophlyctis helioformis]|nr:ubiquitin fusion degradation protein UFD1-domain-containing protein [Entophlyctis helioformis]
MTSRFRLLPVVDPSLTGDRLNLPQSVLDALMNAQAGGGRGSSSPFVFEIRNAAGPLPTRTHGVVREFTAQEGTVCISPFLEEQLQTSAKAADRDANGDADGNANGDAAAADQEQQPVTVTLVELEKCTFARLAPLTPAYLSISDIRSVLESHLRRNHSTLTQGEVLQVTEPSRPDRSHPFVIVELQPAQACLCIDADVAVDVQPLDDAVAEAAVRAKYGIPDHGHLVAWQVPRIPERPVVKLTVDPTEGDVDCFVSLTAEKPTLLDHDWFSVETGKKEVLVDLSTAADVEDPFIYVALVADSPRASFALQFEAVAPSTVEAAAPSESREKQARLVDSAGAEPKPDEAACPNCGASVPLRTLQMHLAFCERNNRKCTKCERVFKKEDLASHWHCDLCDKYCVVSQHEAAPKAPMDPTSAAVLAFQLLQKSALQRPDDPEHYLCIADAASSRRRHVAETVLAPLGFRVAWCVRALQETRDDADRAASWLVSNAPKQ